MTRAVFFRPVLANILRDRRLSSIICGVAVLQLLLSVAGLPGWTCPIFHTLGIPCPGCGLTRASLFLFRGEWKQALVMHAYAPIFLFALAIMALCTIGPKQQVERLALETEALERYTGITFILLSGLILYWLARLLFLQSAFVRLIQG